MAPRSSASDRVFFMAPAREAKRPARNSPPAVAWMSLLRSNDALVLVSARCLSAHEVHAGARRTSRRILAIPAERVATRRQCAAMNRLNATSHRVENTDL